MAPVKEVVVGVTGASGALYATRLLRALLAGCWAPRSSHSVEIRPFSAARRARVRSGGVAG